jgi:hypothetical protein
LSVERPGDQGACADGAVFRLPPIAQPLDTMPGVQFPDEHPQRIDRPPR